MTRITVAFILAVLATQSFAAEDATAIVRAAIDHWRGVSSYSEMTMTIHRPDWERSMSMRAWTRGDEQSLVRITAPVRDRGNATLMNGDNMWTYSPKVNRVIKVPSSMMNQSWMGSDFSNNDISRADDIVEQYRHTLLDEQVVDGYTVYRIEAVPKEGAAVVWGREVMSIRDDHVLLEHAYYDQDGILVKTLCTLDIAEMGGRNVAREQRMENAEVPGEWTAVRLEAVRYGINIDDNLFTLSNLRNPRE